jgi:hypothetical protein
VRVAIDQGDDVGETFTHGIEDGRLGREHRFLRHVGDLQTLLQLQRAVVGPFHAPPGS